MLSFDDLEQTVRLRRVAEQRRRLSSRGSGDFERALEMQQRAVALHENRGAAALYEQALGELGSTYLLMEDVSLGRARI